MPCAEVREASHRRMLFSFSLPEVVLRLHVHPKFRGSAEGSRQPERHIGGDASLAVQQSRQGDTRCAQVRCSRGDWHVSKVLAKNQAGMRRIVHWQLLVIVLIVNEDRILACQPSVSAHADSPVILERPGQRVKFPSRSIEVAGTSSVVQNKQLRRSLLACLG